MALYLKYRPKTWDEIVGSEDQIATLRGLLGREDGPHVFLLTGPAGCGKTTAARIAAADLGATDLGIVELNSSDNRGIDTARAIIDRMRYAPADGAVTVFIVDEIHKSTNDWQNAMLKPLEDTPSHVYFFLATTDPAKLIAPFKTRCSEIKLSAMSSGDLSVLLRRVNKAEGIGVDKESLAEIASAADGSPRRALVLLEKVAGVEDPETRARIIKAGGDDESAETIDFCRALLDREPNWPKLAGILKAMPMDDPERIRYAVLGYMSAVLLGGKRNDRAAVVLEVFSEPTYNSGKAGLVGAAYRSVFAN